MPRDGGDIIYDGRQVGPSLSLRDLRRGVQMVFQDSYASLNPRLTIEESIAFGPKVHGMADDTARTLARELLGKVGLRPEIFAIRTKCPAASASASTSPAHWRCRRGS